MNSIEHATLIRGFRPLPRRREAGVATFPRTSPGPVASFSLPCRGRGWENRRVVLLPSKEDPMARARSRRGEDHPAAGNGEATTPRAFWKGSLSFGLVEIPVTLRPALQ